MRSEAVISIFAIACLILTSCSAVSEEDAERVALMFIKTNVVFHSQNKTVMNPYMQVVNRERTDGNFIFDIIATTTGDEKIKSGRFNVVVDKNGQVIRFNGKPVLMP